MGSHAQTLKLSLAQFYVYARSFYIAFISFTDVNFTRIYNQKLICVSGNLDCKTVSFFFSKSVKKSVKRGVRVLRARSSRASHAHIFSVSPQSRSLFSASFQTFCLTVRAYLNTQKYGLFCSLVEIHLQPLILKRSRKLTK